MKVLDMNNLLYADDVVLLVNNKYDLQYSIHHINIIARESNKEITVKIKNRSHRFQRKISSHKQNIHS